MGPLARWNALHDLVLSLQGPGWGPMIWLRPRYVRLSLRWSLTYLGLSQSEAAGENSDTTRFGCVGLVPGGHVVRADTGGTRCGPLSRTTPAPLCSSTRSLGAFGTIALKSMSMKPHLAAVIFCLLASSVYTQEGTPKGDSKALRVIISSDFPPTNVIPVKAFTNGVTPPWQCSDPDDVQSMVRFLLYADEFDVEGLIASAGTFANVANKTNILNTLDLYAQAYPNLIKHDPRYPTTEKLRSVTWQGRDGAWGAPMVGTTAKPLGQILGEGKDSEASDAIIRVVDRPDPRPVWVCVWGGSREVAQAIWKVQKTRSPAELDRFLGRLRLYLIVKQDSTADWLLENFPGLFIILSEKNYMGMFYHMAGSDPKLADLAWINEHIRQGHGPLGAVYPQSGWDPAYLGQQEGDTPSFLHLVSAVRGLNDPEKPNQAGWGGKFVRSAPSKNHWFDDPAGTQTVSKWRPEVQEDFARRANWMLP
jgi:hypothetical protein